MALSFSRRGGNESEMRRRLFKHAPHDTYLIGRSVCFLREENLPLCCRERGMRTTECEYESQLCAMSLLLSRLLSFFISTRRRASSKLIVVLFGFDRITYVSMYDAYKCYWNTIQFDKLINAIAD